MAGQMPSARDLPPRIDGTTNAEAIVCSRVTTTALDSCLQPVIDIYVNNGTAEQYGTVLFKNIPPSRPRTLAPTKTQTLQEWPLISRLPETKIKGCYILNAFEIGSRSQDWISQIEDEANSAPSQTIDSQQFMDALAQERVLGHQCESIYGMPAGAGYKQQLKVKQWPTNFGRTIISHVVATNSNEFLNGTYLTVNRAGAAIPMEKNMADLVKIFYHHRGSPLIWIVVPPSESQKLENCIKTLFGGEIKEPCCSQFVKHLNLWITPALLHNWGVGYTQVRLEALQMLVFFPSSYYWCLSTGFSIIESKLSGNRQWNVESYRFCDAASSLCNIGGAKGFFEISQADVDAILQLDASGKKRKRPNKKTAEMEELNRITDSPEPEMEELSKVEDAVDPENDTENDTNTGDEVLRDTDVEAESSESNFNGEPAESISDSDSDSDSNTTMGDFEPDARLNPFNIDPQVLMAENLQLRIQVMHLRQSRREMAQLHAATEAELAEVHAAAQEANRVVLERERQIQELLELLYGANAHQGAAAAGVPFGEDFDEN